jgi:ubiquinone/menaquinone biosynthesis C-methylase UbiE
MQHWNSYWSKTKSLNSFAEGEHSQGYTGDIADFWNRLFSTLPSNSTVLDLATGNGGLAVLAQQSNPSFTVFASDAATINPIALYNAEDPTYPTLNKIKFIAEMPSEALEFEDKQFNLVMSQFGFEYAQTTEALEQIFRVLQAKGRFVALVHHKDSFISADCRYGLTVIERIMADDGLFEQLLDFARLCQSITDKSNFDQQQKAEFKQKNNSLLTLFKSLQQNCANEVELDWFNLLAKDLVPFMMNWQETNESKVKQIQQSFYYFKLRLADQLEAAWCEERSEEIIKLINMQGHTVNCKPFDISQGRLCWILDVSI